MMEQAAIYSRGSVRRHGAGIFAGVWSDWKESRISLVLQSTVRSVLGREEHVLQEYLPREIRSRYKLCEYNYAIKEIHFPENMDTLIAARNRLVFDEVFPLYFKYAVPQGEAGSREANPNLNSGRIPLLDAADCQTAV